MIPRSPGAHEKKKMSHDEETKETKSINDETRKDRRQEKIIKQMVYKTRSKANIENQRNTTMGGGYSTV